MNHNLIQSQANPSQSNQDQMNTPEQVTRKTLQQPDAPERFTCIAHEEPSSQHILLYNTPTKQKTEIQCPGAPRRPRHNPNRSRDTVALNLDRYFKQLTVIKY